MRVRRHRFCPTFDVLSSRIAPSGGLVSGVDPTTDGSYPSQNLPPCDSPPDPGTDDGSGSGPVYEDPSPWTAAMPVGAVEPV